MRIGPRQNNCERQNDFERWEKKVSSKNLQFDERFDDRLQTYPLRLFFGNGQPSSLEDTQDLQAVRLLACTDGCFVGGRVNRAHSDGRRRGMRPGGVGARKADARNFLRGTGGTT